MDSPPQRIADVNGGLWSLANPQPAWASGLLLPPVHGGHRGATPIPQARLPGLAEVARPPGDWGNFPERVGFLQSSQIRRVPDHGDPYGE
jgi:hypothetical protein